MQAGLLKYPIEFFEFSATKDWSGSIKKEWSSVPKTKCARKRVSPGGMQINALSEFITSTVLLQVRYNKKIKDTQRFHFNGYRYRIILTERMTDDTIVITGTRLNDSDK